MTCRGKTVVGLIVAAVLLLSGSIAAWSATIVKDGDPNTIGEALAKPDGTTVTLTCEQVMWRGKSGKSFAIKEWTEKTPEQPRLLVVSTQYLPVENWWSVDVMGTLGTFRGLSPDGTFTEQRVLIIEPTNVLIYCDSRGKPLHCAGFKGFEIGGVIKRSLAEFTPQSSFCTAIAELPSIPDKPDPLPPFPGSRDSIKCLPNGARVSVNGAIVYAAFNGFFFVERSDRSFAAKIRSQQPVSVGDIVDITGQINSLDGAITGNTVAVLDSGASLPPLVGMNNKFLGLGLDTTAMMVRVWGKVTYVDAQNELFYIDDGSHLPADYTGTNPLGVKIYSDDITLPAVNDFAVVNGSSDKEVVGGTTIRTIWRTQDNGLSLAQSSSGTGTISGTLTAQGADGQTARVYCGNSCSTVKFVGDTTSYELRIPAGKHAVTATLPGYKTTTQVAVIDGNTSHQDINFTLGKSEMVVDLVVDSAQVLSSGNKEVVFKAIVRDIEGRRLAYQPVSWCLSESAAISADSITDAVGEAVIVLSSPIDVVPEIVAQSGSASQILTW